MPTANPAAAADTRRKRREGPRIPSQGRGVARHAALLDAAEALLSAHNPDEIGLYQIAEQAGVPPASVYHFFPTKEAAFDALAQRLVLQLLATHHEPIEARRLLNWTDLFRIDVDRGRAFYNQCPPALKIFYGGFGGVDAKSIDKIAADTIAASGFDRLDRIFHMPYLKEARRFFEIRLSILDAIWTVSVRRHGFITDDYHQEAFEACIAYSRLYLPAHMERRPLLIEAAERGEALMLPFDHEA